MAVTRRQTTMAASSRPTKRPKNTKKEKSPASRVIIPASDTTSSSGHPVTAGSKAAKRPDADDSEGNVAEKILAAERRMSDSLQALTFRSPVTHIYNPHVYAWKMHEWYVQTYGDTRREILLVGMNPGPWGMAQTGVPFGQVDTVKNWMNMPVDLEIGVPEKVHEKRPIDGLKCARSEVSGRRLWKEFAEAEYGTPENFFSRYFVHNYCPLMFMETTGRNRTPAQLRVKEREPLLQICDVALLEIIQALQPKLVAGIGAFAADRCTKVVQQAGIDPSVVRVGKVLHPSPASPAANKGWLEKFKSQLDELLADVH